MKPNFYFKQLINVEKFEFITQNNDTSVLKLYEHIINLLHVENNATGTFELSGVKKHHKLYHYAMVFTGVAAGVPTIDNTLQLAGDNEIRATVNKPIRERKSKKNNPINNIFYI